MLISGTGFTSDTQVMFDGVAADSTIVLDAGSIIAISPAHAAGAVHVTVTNAAGSSATSAADVFNYQAAQNDAGGTGGGGSGGSQGSSSAPTGTPTRSGGGFWATWNNVWQNLINLDSGAKNRAFKRILDAEREAIQEAQAKLLQAIADLGTALGDGSSAPTAESIGLQLGDANSPLAQADQAVDAAYTAYLSAIRHADTVITKVFNNNPLLVPPDVLAKIDSIRAISATAFGPLAPNSQQAGDLQGASNASTAAGAAALARTEITTTVVENIKEDIDTADSVLSIYLGATGALKAGGKKALAKYVATLAASYVVGPELRSAAQKAGVDPQALQWGFLAISAITPVKTKLGIGGTPWSLTGADRVLRSQRFGTFHRDPKTGLWWSTDKAGHGGSAFKVFRETSTGLQWIADADNSGNFIKGKHKGPTGLFIAFKELFGR